MRGNAISPCLRCWHPSSTVIWNGSPVCGAARGRLTVIDRPLVSIITPTYNHGRFIRQCIDSVLTQTYPHWEQIIVDDGSTDGTVDVAREVHDGRVRVVSQVHRGIFRLADTYNDTLRAAHGDLIAILEGDDFWPPDKLETLAPALAEDGVVMAFGTTAVTTADGRPTGWTIPEPSFIEKFGANALLNRPVGAATKVMFQAPRVTYTFPCSTVIRRSALEAIGGFQHIDGIPFVDYQTFLALSLIGRFFYTPRVMGYWRRHSGSATALRYQDLTEIRLLAYMRRFLDANRARMGLAPHEEAAIADTLGDWDRRIALFDGLAALQRSEWADARSRFRMSLRSRQRVVRVAGAVGTTASYMHVRLEWLLRILSKLFDRQARWTGVQRRINADAARQDLIRNG